MPGRLSTAPQLVLITEIDAMNLSLTLVQSREIGSVSAVNSAKSVKSARGFGSIADVQTSCFVITRGITVSVSSFDELSI